MPEINYVIRDRTGNPLAIHRRIDYVDNQGNPNKDVTWWQPDGTPGLNGISVKSMLYGLEMLDQYPDVSTILLCEGEKSADALNRVGFLALGTVSGAGTGKAPTREVLENLAGRKVVLWPDNDDIGREHMAEISAVLYALGIEVNLVEWAEAPPKGDAADLIHNGVTATDVKQTVRLTPYVPPPPAPPPDDGRPDGCRVWKTDPARWEFHWPQAGLRNDGWLPVGTAYVLSWGRVQTAHLDYFYRAPGWVPTRSMPWSEVAGALIEDRVELEAPVEETVAGRVLAHLVRFLGTEAPNDPADPRAEPENVQRGGSWWELETGMVHFQFAVFHRDVYRHEDPGDRLGRRQVRQGIEELGGQVAERRRGSREDRWRLSSIPWSIFDFENRK